MRSQGSGCSPVKAVRELGLERSKERLPGVILGCLLAYIGGTRLQQTEAARAIPREGKGVNATTAAYIAGFLDGDGSIHLQLIRQQEYRYGFYVRVSVIFHQHQSGRRGLEWLKDQLWAGYIRDRVGQMSDYVITSRPIIRALLTQIAPYVVFKRRQVEVALKLLDAIDGINDQTSFLAVARQVEAFKSLNRSKRKINTVEAVLAAWRAKEALAPVTTDPAKGEILMQNGQNQTPAPRKRVEI